MDMPYTARQALNMVRNRTGVAMPAVTVADVPGFRQAVKQERRVELAFENYRYWDLLRWKDAAACIKSTYYRSNGYKEWCSGQFVYTPFNVENRVIRCIQNVLLSFSAS